MYGTGVGGNETTPETIVVLRESRVFPSGEAPPDFHSFNPETSGVTWEQYGKYWYAERTEQTVPINTSIGFKNFKEAWELNSGYDYYTICNEQGGGEYETPEEREAIIHNLRQLVNIERSIMQQANADGIKCCVLNLAGGSPGDFEIWKEICAPFIMEAWENGGNIYGRHCYADKFVNADGSIVPGQPQRVIDELNYLRSIGYGGGMVLTECGMYGGYTVADFTYFEDQLKKWETVLSQHSDIFIGLCWWECGDTDFSADYTEHLKKMVPHMNTSGLTKWEPKKEENVEKHKAIVVKLPQDMTADEWSDATATAFPFRHTVTASHDDMMTVLSGGNEESFVKFSHPERDESSVLLVESAGYAWERLYPEPEIEIIDIVDELPKHATLKYVTRPLSGVTHITIHHTVSPPDRSIESIAAYHVDGNGWPGIGYHFVIKADGRIFQTNYLTTKSYHAGSAAAPGDENAYSVGIALQGDFTNNPPPQAQLDAAKNLVSYLRSEIPSAVNTLGHRQMPGASTQCPGNTFNSWLPYITGSGTPPPSPPPPPPPPSEPKVDMLAYLRGPNGVQYEMRRPDGSQERYHVQWDVANPQVWYIVKGENQGFYEKWSFDDNYIYLEMDTSPSSASDGTQRYYTVTKNGARSPKYRRFMSVGEVFNDGGHLVQFYNKANCQPHPENSGNTANTTTFVQGPYKDTFYNNITSDGVLKVLENTEYQYWVRGIGRVRWESTWGDAQISEIHGIGQRPDVKREFIPCL